MPRDARKIHSMAYRGRMGMIDDSYKEASSACSVPRQTRVIIFETQSSFMGLEAPQVTFARPVRAGM
jgi:hypothetical protein